MHSSKHTLIWNLKSNASICNGLYNIWPRVLLVHFLEHIPILYRPTTIHQFFLPIIYLHLTTSQADTLLISYNQSSKAHLCCFKKRFPVLCHAVNIRLCLNVKIYFDFILNIGKKKQDGIENMNSSNLKLNTPTEPERKTTCNTENNIRM